MSDVARMARLMAEAKRRRATNTVISTIGECALELLRSGAPITGADLVSRFEERIASSASAAGLMGPEQDTRRIAAEEALKHLRRSLRPNFEAELEPANLAD